jgi:Zn-dependent protease
MSGNVETFLYLLPVLLASMTLHELAHAWVADRLGDPTPREHGRLTLNPIPHIDPLGTAMFAITYFTTPFIFGWARPVLVTPANFRKPKEHMGLVAIAGPIVNFVIALVCLAVLVHGDLDPFGEAWRVISLSYQVNLVLGIFNLIPIPPLDGSRIVGAFLSDDLYIHWSRLDQYGMIGIFALVIVFQSEFNEIMSSLFDHSTEAMLRIVGG